MSPSRRKRDQRRARRAAGRARLLPNLCAPLMRVWRHARWVWTLFCECHGAPRAIAAREWIATWAYREMLAWVRTIELLTRRLILAAALALDVVLRPTTERPQRPRKRRRILVWPGRPQTWIARLAMFPPRPPEKRVIYHNRRVVPRTMSAMPLARRLEAVRRVLADPDRRVHRFAVKLARIRARNAKANEPRLFGVREWDPRKSLTRARRTIDTGMAIVMPIVESRLEAWNQACEPG